MYHTYTYLQTVNDKHQIWMEGDEETLIFIHLKIKLRG